MAVVGLVLIVARPASAPDRTPLSGARAQPVQPSDWSRPEPPSPFGVVRQLLHRPPVAVRIGEVDERAPRLHIDLAHRSARGRAAPSRAASASDTTICSASSEPGAILVRPLADRDRTGRPGRGELDETDLVAHRLVHVEHEADLVDVEVPGPIDVGDRHAHQFKFEVHTANLAGASDTPALRVRGRPVEYLQMDGDGRRRDFLVEHR